MVNHRWFYRALWYAETPADDVKSCLSLLLFDTIKPWNNPPTTSLTEPLTSFPFTNISLMRYLSTALRVISASFRPRTASAVNSSELPFRFYRHYFRPPFPLRRTTLLKAAPTVPILGSFFSSSAKAESPDDSNMSPPNQRSDAEWQAVLSPGWFPSTAYVYLFHMPELTYR